MLGNFNTSSFYVFLTMVSDAKRDLRDLCEGAEKECYNLANCPPKFNKQGVMFATYKLLTVKKRSRCKSTRIDQLIKCEYSTVFKYSLSYLGYLLTSHSHHMLIHRPL